MRRLGPAVAAGSAVLVLASCSVPTVVGGGAPARATQSQAPAAPPHLTVSPGSNGQGLPLDTPVYVVADSGRLTGVNFQEAGVGTPSGGQLSPDGHTWHMADGLDSSASYTLTATASNGAQTVSSHVSFTTLSAGDRLVTNVFPGDGSTVGVGEPIDLTFNTSIPDDRKAALLNRIQVTSNPGVMGAWHWFSDRQVHFRPQSYWPSGTKVNITANLKGFDAGNGTWGLGDWAQSFTVGAKHVSLIDDTTHQMQVYDNDQLINTWPVSMGKPGFPTLEGTLVVLFKVYKVKMNSCSTFGTSAACVPGGANYYDEDVFYDTAISTNGFFIHAAPWSVYAQGSYDVSHGCVNLSTDRAITFYNWSQIGDVVVISHTGNVADITNGEADWQIPFSQFTNTPGDSPVFTGNGSGPTGSGVTHTY